MTRNTKKLQPFFAIVIFTASLCGNVEADNVRMRIAEWGTFTVLQNNEGEALPGVNVNEERLPSFVHRLAYHIVPQVSQISPVAGLRSKGIPASYPYAIMRMETPIIYFYPPETQTTPVKIDVSVGFRGGWISEWYPQADVEAPGFKNSLANMGAIAPHKTGTIVWKNLQVGGDVKLPHTSEHVWLAPRDVDSARVTTSNGEHEQYLFYRGVANIESPLRVLRSRKDSLTIETNGWLLETTDECHFAAIWLADIRADGKVAFREFPPATVRGQAMRQTVGGTSNSFSETQYRTANLDELRDSMTKALIEEGLTSQEADAMLNTWKLSYFQSPGLRLFFTLPRQWTDAILPLSVSTSADITRVMIGRIELVTSNQQQLVNSISKGSISTTKWFADAMQRMPADERQQAWKQLYREETTFAELEIDVPNDYQAYLDLGRFRDAIVLDRLRRNPNENLKKFTQNYFIHLFDSPPSGGGAPKLESTAAGH